MEEAVRDRLDAGDANHRARSPAPSVITADLLADGIHPGDAGQARLAEVFGAAVRRGAAAVRRAGRNGG